MPENEDRPDAISFTQFVMQELFEPGNNPTHLVEDAIIRLVQQGNHFHAFQVMFVPDTGTFEAVWLCAPEEYWQQQVSEWAQMRDDVENMLEGLENVANGETPPNQ